MKQLIDMLMYGWENPGKVGRPPEDGLLGSFQNAAAKETMW
ncbi:hypothetical protein [Cyclobacterium xiamenense]|nr:hypothetical protein [Cyclobacterium xiamenense]